MAGTIKSAGWMVLALSIMFPASGFGRDDGASDAEREKQRRQEVQDMIKEFRKEFNGAKTEADKASAVRGLGGTEHSLVATELLKMMKVPLVSVRREAATGLGRYSNNPQLSDILLRYGESEKDEGVTVAILDAVGEISACRGVQRLPGFYDKSIAVAGKAIEVSGAIGSRDVVQPLIREMGKLERMKALNGNLPGTDTRIPRSVEGEGKKRKDALLPKAKAALRAITGESFANSKEYENWWKANARTFRDAEEKRAIEEKGRKEEENREEYRRLKEELKEKEEEKKRAREEEEEEEN